MRVLFGIIIFLLCVGCGASEAELPDDSDIGGNDENHCGDSHKECMRGTVCLQRVKICKGRCDDRGVCQCDDGANVRYEEVKVGTVVESKGEDGDVRILMKSREGDKEAFRCGCAEKGMASCPGQAICGTQIMGNDAKNCGACGAECSGEGSKCESGQCRCYEDGKVVDLKKGEFEDGSGKSKSCGACGYECSQGSNIGCEDGLCVDSSCETSDDGIRKMRCDGECVDLRFDAMHCERCGRRCGDGHCDGGKCICKGNKVACGGEDGVCVEESDKFCGSDCVDCSALGKSCAHGLCQCEKGGVPCGDNGACVSQNDEICGASCANCKSEGKFCSESGECVLKGNAKCGVEGGPHQDVCPEGGICDCGSVADGYQCWSGKCACGSAGKLCKSGEKCVNGVCQCGSGAECVGDSVCVNGVCQCGGKVCHGGSVCSSGKCLCGGVECRGDSRCVSGRCQCGSSGECKGSSMCVSGTCQCLSGQVAIYSQNGELISCDNQCGGVRGCSGDEKCVRSGGSDKCMCGNGPSCGNGLVCGAGKCRCGSSWGEPCGSWGVCAGSMCRCREGSVLVWDKHWSKSNCVYECGNGVKSCPAMSACVERNGQRGCECLGNHVMVYVDSKPSRCESSCGGQMCGSGAVCVDEGGGRLVCKCGVGGQVCGQGNRCDNGQCRKVSCSEIDCGSAVCDANDGKCKCKTSVCGLTLKSVDAGWMSQLSCGLAGGSYIRGDDYCGCKKGWTPVYTYDRIFIGCVTVCDGMICASGAECVQMRKDIDYECRCNGVTGGLCGGEGAQCGTVMTNKNNCDVCGKGMAPIEETISGKKIKSCRKI